jgi:uncharacterized repeat protein (TIGR02543 family)
MSKINLKLWNFRVRRILVVALVAPLFTAITAVSPQPAYALATPTTGGAYFDRSLPSYLSVSASSNFALTTSENFTIAWWQYSTNNTDWPRTWRFGSGSNELTISQEGGTFYLWRNTQSYSSTLFTQTNTLNNWVHYAIVRTSGTLRIYENAIQKVSVANTQAFGDSSSPFLIGTNLSYSDDQRRVNFGGLLTGFEFIKGTAKYSGTSTTAENFSPATTLAGYTTSVTSGTKLLLFPTSSADLLTDRSGSGGNYTITNTASPSDMPVKFGNLPATITYSLNGATGTVPSAVTQSAPAQAFSLPTSSGFPRSNFTFKGWNTQADGRGTNYPAGFSYTPDRNITLYAQWNSVIAYDPNTATSSRAIESTTATSSQASTTLSNGKLVPGSPVASGLLFNLNAADSSSVSGTSWVDINRNGISGALVGSPTYNSQDGYFQLNGTNQWINLGSTVMPAGGRNTFTASVMFKSDKPSSDDAAIMSRFHTANYGPFIIRNYAHNTVTAWRWNTDISATTRYNEGDINYATVSYNGTTWKLYLNGVLQSSSNLGDANSSTADLVLGATGYQSTMNRLWAGRIYSAQGYSRALTDAEVLANYQALLPGQKVSKTNFTLVPWNTSSAGTGTSIGSTVTDLSALPTPYMRLQPSNYNAAAKTWSSTPGSSSFTYRGTPEFIASNNGKFGATGNFAAIGGTTSDGIHLGNPTLTTYTLCVVARYRGLASSPATVASTGRIINAKSENWISGYYWGGTAQFHHNSTNNLSGPTADLNWHYHCDSGNKAYWDGVKLTPWTNTTTTYLPSLSINGWDSGQYSDWELADLIIYDQFLPDSQIEHINRYFRNTYGILAGPSSTAAAVSVSPSTTYASSGDATLYANWGSAITYDGNKQTSGSVPSPSLITGASGNLASNSGTLVRAGFRFDGWNTNAAGTGTTYAAGSSYPNTGNTILYAKWTLRTLFPTTTSVIEPNNLLPYMRYKASDYDATAKTWRDSSGNARNVSLIEGSPSVVTTTANTNGSTKSIQVLQGVTTDQITFDNPTTTSGQYTLFSLIRYNSATTTKQRRTLNSIDNTWFTGHHGQKAGISYHEGAWLKSVSTVSPITNWVLGTDYASAYRSNGVQQTLEGNGGANLRRLGINTFTGESSDFQIAEIILYDRALTLAEIKQVEDYLSVTYGITAHTVSGTYASSTSLAIGAGVGGRSETLTATNGLGNKIITMSPSRSGITLETTTANSANVVVSPTAATGVYAQIITATDTTGETSTHTLTITVNPSIKFEISTTTTLVTTLGKSASMRLNTTGGVGTRVFTITRPTNVPLSGITIDTSTAVSSNYVTLNVSDKVLPGTYAITVSATDSTKVRTSRIVTVTVNKLPSLTFTNGITDTTTVVRSGLHLQYEIGQSYTGSGTTVLDLSGNNRNGYIISGTPYNSTLGGGSIAVNRTNYLQTQPGVIANSDSISRFYWIYPRSATQTLMTVCNAGCSYIESELELSNSRLFARVWNMTSVSTQETLTLNTWHYVGYIFNAATNTTSIYINGQLSASAVSTGTRDSPGTQYELMGYNTSTNMQTPLQGDYSLGSVHYYKRVLTESEIFTNYAATAPRFLSSSFPGLSTSGSATITTTEGRASTHSLFTATEGTGGKAITLSSATTGITLDTSTANSAILNIAGTVAATNSTTQRVISTSVVATDSVTATTTYPLTLRINPPIIISAAIPLTLSTTAGKTAYDTFTATYGTGNKTFTAVSASYPSGFVMTNPSTNVGLLTVSSSVPAGTYSVTVTATDSVTATTTYALSVVVNPVPTIAGATGNSVTTTLARSTSLRINVIGGTGVRTISWTSPNAGITIESSTITSQNFITLNVSSAVPAATYSFAITAVDSLSASVSDTFTVTVNRWPVIASSSVVQSGLVVNLDASTYSGSGNWLDSSGFGRNAVGATASTTPAGTAPAYSTESGGIFSFNEGSATTNHMLIPNPGTLETFTVSTWIRLKSIPTNNTAIIAQYWPGGTNTINYTIAFSGSSIYGAYYRGSSNWTSSTSSFTPVINTWYQITYLVSKSGNNYFQDLYVNGVKQGSTVDAGTIAPASNGSVISLGRRWDFDATKILNGSFGNVSIYNRALSAAEILQNYNATGARYVSTNSGNETLTVTQGTAGSLSGVVATQGTGNKTFTLSSSNAGINIDTTTANTFSLALANTLTATSTTVARTLTETVTATDSAGATTSRVYTITVNPPIRVESTTSVITTTSGIVAWDTFTATLGTGNKTFTLAGTPNVNGFTLTQANNQAVLRVGSTVNPGTYTLTITVTDAVGAVSALTKTVVVNTLPTITGNTSVAGTRGYTFNSPTYSAAGGTGNLTFSISTSPAISGGNVSGIKLSATTGTPTIIVESTTAADTYTVTLRVTDSLTTFSTFTVTLKVNPPVTLTGSLTLSKVYGEELSQVYTTGGGTPPFNIFASTVCTSEKSTYVGNGTNGTLGVTYTVEKLNGVGSCNWAVPKDVTNVSVLTVAGGGGGGGTAWAGGGGAGGVVFANSVTVTSGALVPIVVGAGGAGGQNNDTCSSGSSPSQGSNGNNSSFNATFTAVGGGGGGGYGWSGRAGCGSGKLGGSGGGSGETDYNPVRASSTQGTFAGATSSGNSGGITVFLGGIQAGSGGGGAGGIGASTGNSRNHVAGNGGTGIAYSITGTSTFYGGGGGGATCISGCTAGAVVGTGGSGGGGNGGHGGASPVNGTNGLGGGGGGSQTGLGATGGSGTVVVRYVTPAVDTETTRITLDTLSVTPTGSLRLNAPRNLPVGTYTQTITAIDSSATPASTTATVTLTVAKATPTVALSLPGSVTTAKYGNPVTISAIATTAGNIAFVNGSTNITACTAVVTTAGLATCSWTPTVVGATTLKATLTPTDSTNYNSSAQVSLPITVAKADTLTVTVASLTRQYTGSAVAVTGVFTTTGLVAIDSLTAISMLYAGTANDGNAYSNTTAPTNAGTYSIRPNFPTNANAYTFGVGSAGTTSSTSNYESVTVVAGTLTIGRAPQVMTFSYPNSNTATYSPTGTITASATARLDSAVRSYSSSTLTKCTIDSSTAVISIVEAGSCQVNMVVAQTFNYLADTATATVTINKATRTFSLTPAVSTLKYSESTTVTATLSAGAADGTISYTLGSPAGCTFDPLSGELVAISGTIQCPLTATISEGVNYLAETTTAMSLTIARANAPIITIDTVTAMNHTPDVRALVTPTYTVAGLKNLDTAESLTFTYSFVSNPFASFSYSDTRTPIDAGTYRITPSALNLSVGLISNYETPTYSASAIDFIINRINQETVTVENTNSEVSVPFALNASGGSTTEAFTFNLISGSSCSIDANRLNASAAGTCVVTVTRGGNRNYLPATSAQVTVRVRNFVVVVVEVPSNPVTGITIAPTTPIVKGPDVCTSGCVPTLTSADVYDVAEGDLIILTGTNLQTVTKVYFNIYTEAPNFTADSDTQISVRVPADLPQGDATIEVVSPGGTSNRLFDFIILP